MIRKTLSLILIFSFAATGCQTRRSQPEVTDSAAIVITEKIKKVTSSEYISLSGNIEGYKTVRLGFMVAGKIDYIAVNEGQMVKKGELIASLDPASYSIAKEMADIQVAQVEDEYNRLKIMHDGNSLSESDFSKITYGLQQAKAQQKLHTKNLAETKLYSPIEGVMLKKLAETGEITGVGMPLFVISDIRKIKVNAFIPESELQKIKPGQKAEVQVSSIPQKYEGGIIEVGSAADAASRSFSIKVEINNPGLLIRPGMIAEVRIFPETENAALTVPAGSVLHDYNGQSYVFIADSIKNLAFRRDVSPGKIINGNIKIISGLSEGELIVTGGQQKLVDRSAIRISK
jgi:membrane fusion protein, multidrug efflux system